VSSPPGVTTNRRIIAQVGTGRRAGARRRLFFLFLRPPIRNHANAKRRRAGEGPRPAGPTRGRRGASSPRRPPHCTRRDRATTIHTRHRGVGSADAAGSPRRTRLAARGAGAPDCRLPSRRILNQVASHYPKGRRPGAAVDADLDAQNPPPCVRRKSAAYRPAACRTRGGRGASRRAHRRHSLRAPKSGADGRCARRAGKGAGDDRSAPDGETGRDRTAPTAGRS